MNRIALPTRSVNQNLESRSTRRARRWGALLACLAGWCSPAVLGANPAPAPAPSQPSDAAAGADGEAAKQLFQQGQSEYDLAHFKEALSLFEQAYKRKNVAALLYNIAQCHRQLGDLKMAKATYKAFLAKQPTSPFATMASEKLAEVEQALAGQAQAQTAAPTGLAPAGPLERRPEEIQPPPPPRIVRVQEPETKPAAAAKVEPVKSEPTATTPPPAPAKAAVAKEPEPVKVASAAPAAAPAVAPTAAPAPAAPKKPAPGAATGARPTPAEQVGGSHTWAWVSGGAAALALGGGVVFALQSKSTASEISGTEHTGAQVKQLQSDLSSQSSKANLLLGVGAGLAVLSAACFYFNF
jgi:hypothetical protein